VEAPRLPQSDPDARESWSQADDAVLLAGIRRGVEAAVAEFVARYAPMLVGIARRRGLGHGDVSTVVVDFLDTAALRLAGIAGRIPHSLPAYLAVSFRRRLDLDWRTAKRRDMRESRMATEIASGKQRAIAETSSEYVIRTTAGIDAGGTDADVDPGEAQLLREQLALALAKGVDDEDRRLLGYLADRMPQREIAEIFGITHGNARVRILRLRERLAGVAREYINTLPANEAIVLSRFLERGPRRSVRDAEHARPPDRESKRAQSPPAGNPGTTGNRGASHE
jgi:RNA polymerase sigma factor (sigma-70 family)